MTTVHHTPYAFGSALNAAGDNVPLGQLDAAIVTVEDKLGTGASTPVAGELLTGTGTGASQWLTPTVDHDHSSALDGTILVPNAIFPQTFVAPTQITGNVNDWNPNGLDIAFFVELSLSATWNITGIVAPATGSRMHLLYNSSGGIAILKHNTGSAAANAFYLPNSSDLALTQGDAVMIFYSVPDGKWRVLAGYGVEAV